MANKQQPQNETKQQSGSKNVSMGQKNSQQDLSTRNQKKPGNLNADAGGTEDLEMSDDDLDTDSDVGNRQSQRQPQTSQQSGNASKGSSKGTPGSKH